MLCTKRWTAAALILCVAAGPAAAAAPRGADDTGPGVIAQNQVIDKDRSNDRRVDDSRVNPRRPDRDRDSDRRDDPLARNNLERDDPMDGVIPMEQDYSAALVRCDRLVAAAKSQCVAAVNRKFGRM